MIMLSTALDNSDPKPINQLFVSLALVPQVMIVMILNMITKGLIYSLPKV